jgi:ATP-binding cassette subfamily F protein 3
VVLELSSFSKIYPNDEGGLIPVFENAGPLTISRGDKIALIGKNGAGKSTLARMIIGTEPFDGERKEGHNVEVTFFAQHQAESLNPQNTILEELSSEAAARSEVEIRTLLGAFLFTDTDVFKKISVLSGGEKSRVALAKTLLSPKNFMILDEPTNHLDIQSRNVLVDALNRYNGTFVVVSHDRLFLDRISNKVWYAEKGKLVTYPGNYSEFRYHQSLRDGDGASGTGNGRPSAIRTDAGNGPAEVKPALSKREEAERRNRLYRELADKGIENMENWEELSSGQLKTALKDLEEKIHSSEEKKSELEGFLADPENFRDAKRSEEVTREYGTVNDNLRKLYERWEAVSAHLEGRAPGE